MWNNYYQLQYMECKYNEIHVGCSFYSNTGK